MARQFRKQKPKYGRRPATRQPKPRILVVCEGQTERDYVQQFADACRNRLVDVKISKAVGRSPIAIVERAIQDRAQNRSNARDAADDNVLYDAVWCVFDADDHAWERAIQLAEDDGIEVAFSNACFELWLLLHFRESPGMWNRGKLQTQLKKFVSKYDKHVVFTDYQGGYPEAAKRAEALDRAAEADGERHRNPTTGVYRLTQVIGTPPLATS